MAIVDVLLDPNIREELSRVSAPRVSAAMTSTSRLTRSALSDTLVHDLAVLWIATGEGSQAFGSDSALAVVNSRTPDIADHMQRLR
jgi:hypothetical protein